MELIRELQGVLEAAKVRCVTTEEEARKVWLRME